MPLNTEQLKTEWAARLQPLVGLRIKKVRYATAEECAALAISRAPVIFEMGDGTLIWPMSDDEGNDAGALRIQPGRTLPPDLDGAPVI